MGVKVEQLPSRVEEVKRVKLSYVRELREELKKVTWTTKEEAFFFTKLVVGFTFAFGIGIYIVDLAIKGILNGFTGLVHLIFG